MEQLTEFEALYALIADKAAIYRLFLVLQDNEDNQEPDPFSPEEA